MSLAVGSVSPGTCQHQQARARHYLSRAIFLRHSQFHCAVTFFCLASLLMIALFFSFVSAGTTSTSSGFQGELAHKSVVPRVPKVKLSASAIAAKALRKKKHAPGEVRSTVTGWGLRIPWGLRYHLSGLNACASERPGFHLCSVFLVTLLFTRPLTFPFVLLSSLLVFFAFELASPILFLLLLTLSLSHTHCPGRAILSPLSLSLLTFIFLSHLQRLCARPSGSQNARKRRQNSRS